MNHGNTNQSTLLLTAVPSKPVIPKSRASSLPQIVWKKWTGERVGEWVCLNAGSIQDAAQGHVYLDAYFNCVNQVYTKQQTMRHCAWIRHESGPLSLNVEPRICVSACHVCVCVSGAVRSDARRSAIWWALIILTSPQQHREIIGEVINQLHLNSILCLQVVLQHPFCLCVFVWRCCIRKMSLYIFSEGKHRWVFAVKAGKCCQSIIDLSVMFSAASLTAPEPLDHCFERKTALELNLVADRDAGNSEFPKRVLVNRESPISESRLLLKAQTRLCRRLEEIIGGLVVRFMETKQQVGVKSTQCSRTSLSMWLTTVKVDMKLLKRETSW